MDGIRYTDLPCTGLYGTLDDGSRLGEAAKRTSEHRSPDSERMEVMDWVREGGREGGVPGLDTPPALRCSVVRCFLPASTPLYGCEHRGTALSLQESYTMPYARPTLGYVPELSHRPLLQRLQRLFLLSRRRPMGRLCQPTAQRCGGVASFSLVPATAIVE